MTKTCQRCGSKQFDRCPNAKYCFDCVAELNRESARERMRRNRARKKLKQEAPK